MVEFNNDLAFVIMDELIRLGVRRNFWGFNGCFTSSELGKVRRLVIRNATSLENIDKLPNLTEVIIYSEPADNSEFLDEKFYNHVVDFTPLEKLPNLEVLRIYNDSNIEVLNIEKLKKLRIINLVNNGFLKELKGLSTLTHLEEVKIYGNSLRTIDDVKSYIINTRDTEVNILDINMFFGMFSKNQELRGFLEMSLHRAMSNLMFGEKVSFDDRLFIIDYFQAKSMYIRAGRIIKYLGINWPITLEEIKKVHAYIAFKIKYDAKGLEYRSDIYPSLQNGGKKNDYLLKRLKLMNSSYAALINHCAICEGYVNMMIYILNMLGVEAKMVNSAYGRQEFDHAVIKFKINDVWYYADPERERTTKGIDFFAFSFEEFKQMYHLPYKEIIEIRKLRKESADYGQNTGRNINGWGNI